MSCFAAFYENIAPTFFFLDVIMQSIPNLLLIGLNLLLFGFGMIHCLYFLASHQITGKIMPDAASNSSSLVAIAVANAFALSIAVYISGGHVDPEVTFGMAIGGHVNIPMAISIGLLRLVVMDLEIRVS